MDVQGRSFLRIAPTLGLGYCTQSIYTFISGYKQSEHQRDYGRVHDSDATRNEPREKGAKKHTTGNVRNSILGLSVGRQQRLPHVVRLARH